MRGEIKSSGPLRSGCDKVSGRDRERLHVRVFWALPRGSGACGALSCPARLAVRPSGAASGEQLPPKTALRWLDGLLAREGASDDPLELGGGVLEAVVDDDVGELALGLELALGGAHPLLHLLGGV